MESESEEEMVYVDEKDWKGINPNLPYPVEEMKHAIKLPPRDYRQWMRDLKKSMREEAAKMENLMKLTPEEHKAQAIAAFKSIPDYKAKLDTGEIVIWLNVLNLTYADVDHHPNQ
jgi:hypothetical protein